MIAGRWVSRGLGALLILAALAGAAHLWGSWLAAESKARVLEIEAALADTTAKLRAARQQEQRDRSLNARLRAQLEESQATNVAHADSAAELAVEIVEDVDSLVAQVEPAVLREAISDAFGRYRQARGEESAGLRLALVDARDIIFSLAADTLSLRRELSLSDQENTALKEAKEGLHAEIGTLQKQLHPGFWTRVLRTGRDVGIGVGIGWVTASL